MPGRESRPQERDRRAVPDAGHRWHPDHDGVERQGLALRHAGALKRRGPRLACEQALRKALQTAGMAVRQQFGHLGRDVACGVQLRHDHGNCFIVDDFQTQFRA